MARKTARESSPSDWLLNGEAGPPARRNGSAGSIAQQADPREWTVAGAGRGRSLQKRASRTSPRARGKTLTGEKAGTRSERERTAELSAKLKQERMERAAERSVLVDRIRELERETGSPGDSASVRRAGRGRLRLSEATFADLRGLGLSILQSTRLIAAQRQGTVATFAQVRHLPGFSEATVAKLRGRVSLR